jgi:hypothetical protein
MWNAIRGLSVLCLLLLLSACVSGGGPRTGDATRPRADLITREEIERGQWSNVYDMVKDLRSRWLVARGVDTITGKPGEVQAHLDDTRLGGVEALRSIPTAAIVYIRWHDPVDAAGRWGLGHGHGAVYVSTRPR